MADDPTGAESTETGGENSGWTPPATQEDLNRIIKERVDRERAKYSDYNDLKSKATKYAEFEESQKSELQRAKERAETLERELTQIHTARQIDTWKGEIAAESKVPAELLSGSTKEELQAHAEKLAPYLTSNNRLAAVIPGPGNIPDKPVSDDAAWFGRALRGE